MEPLSFRRSWVYSAPTVTTRKIGFAKQAAGVERAVGKGFGRLVLPFGTAHQAFHQVMIFGAVKLRDCFGVAPGPIALVRERVADAG